MPARHAVLLTPSVSLRPSQALSCAQIMPVYPEQRTATPRIPFFVFKALRTLSFSVSRKSCVCHSYENGRVCTNNSHSGTLRRALAKLPSTPSMEAPVVVFRSAHFGFSATGVCPDPVGALNPSFSLDFQLSTLGLLIHYPLSFQTLADSFALSKNSTLFFSSNSGLFPKNTRGGTPHHLSSDLRRVRSLPAGCPVR